MIGFKNVTGYLCPKCGACWGSAKFAAECCGPEIKTIHAFKCLQCTWLYKTIEEAKRCKHDAKREGGGNRPQAGRIETDPLQSERGELIDTGHPDFDRRVMMEP